MRLRRDRTEHLVSGDPAAVEPDAADGERETTLPSWIYEITNAGHGSAAPPAPVGAELAHALLTIPESAAQLRVSQRTVRRLIARRELPAIKVGRSIRIRIADIEALLRRAYL